tara:strand:- start:1478 stop:1894 length:417 start_codon:yes stop_codon:yes gene_type:complete
MRLTEGEKNLHIIYLAEREMNYVGDVITLERAISMKRFDDVIKNNLVTDDDGETFRIRWKIHTRHKAFPIWNEEGAVYSAVTNENWEFDNLRRHLMRSIKGRTGYIAIRFLTLREFALHNARMFGVEDEVVLKEFGLE